MLASQLLFLLAADVTLNELALDLMKNKSVNDRELTEYTFDFQHILTRLDAKGKEKERTVSEGESFVSGRRSVDVALRWNGVETPREIVERKRMAAAKLLQADYEDRLRQPRGSAPGPEYGSTTFGVRIEIFATLRKCALRNLRTAPANDGAEWQFDYEPAPGCRYSGTFWVDTTDRMVRRWTGRGDGTEWEDESIRLADGRWAPRRIRVRKKSAQLEAEFNNYKRFVVEVEQRPAGLK
ncbi:MAG: hypothetical protein FJW30_16555 [Acidobacteria bacterium]|nr:hypothetical protein [Acidobacteriota bacterium]